MAARVSAGAVIPLRLLQDQKVGCSAKLLYGILNMRSTNGRVEMSLTELGGIAGVLPNNVPRLVAELEAQEWIRVQHGGPGQKSIYTLILEK